MASEIRQRRARPTPTRWWAEDGWLAIAGPALVLAGCAMQGAPLPPAALSLACIWAVLIGICLACPRLRADLARLDGLALPALGFALTIAAVVWSMTPYTPGGPHPVWSYVGLSPGAATVDISQTRLELLKVLGLGCVFLVGAFTGASDRRARLALATVMAFGVAFAAWAFLTFVTTRGPEQSRLAAGFGTANTAGTLFATLLLLTAGLLVSRLRAGGAGRWTSASLPAVAALTFLICLFMTASRGAFASAAAGFLVLAGLHVFGTRVRLSRAVGVGAAGVLAVLLLMALAGDQLIDRLLGAGRDLGSRATVHALHWRAFLDSPLLGYGLGTFDTINRALTDKAHLSELWRVSSAHNVYLQWLEGAGLAGALPMFLAIGALILTTLRKALRRSRAVSLLFGLLAADVVVLVHGATDISLEAWGFAAMWAYLLGLQFALAQGRST